MKLREEYLSLGGSANSPIPNYFLYIIIGKTSSRAAFPRAHCRSWQHVHSLRRCMSRGVWGHETLMQLFVLCTGISFLAVLSWLSGAV